jgi:methionine-rich copper-binding protein CopC
MPATTSSPRSLARFVAAAAATLVLTAGGMLAASPASAHDELLGSDPAADATIAALPAQLTLTFSGDISTEQGANEIQVTDAAGTDLAAGDFTVQDNVLTQPLEGAASGVVTVLWKVVSSDGHPIAGDYSFTVTPATTPTPTETATPTPTPSDTVAPSPSASAAADDDGDAGESLPWIIGGLILAAVLGAVVYLLVSRSRRERDKAALDAAAVDAADPPSTGSEPPAER